MRSLNEIVLTFVFPNILFLFISISLFSPSTMEEISDLAVLNQKLLDEISNLQIRMIDMLKENFRIKAELDTLKRYLKKNGSSATNHIPFYVARHSRKMHNNDSIAGSRQGRGKSAERFFPRNEIEREYLESTSPKENHSGESLSKKVAEMDRFVGELDRKTRIHETDADVPSLVRECNGSRQETESVAPMKPESIKPVSLNHMRTLATPLFTPQASVVIDVRGSKTTPIMNASLPGSTMSKMTKSPFDDNRSSIPLEETEEDVPPLIPQYRHTDTMIEAINEMPVITQQN